MKTLRPLLLFGISVFVLASCGTVALTGRNQLLLYSDSDILSLSEQSYQEFCTTAVASSNANATNVVKGVCNNLLTAMSDYFTQTGQQHYMADLNWRCDLVKSNEVNAFCMPSGKIVVYEGILSYANTPDLLAVVIGHEIAHAIARHSNERMSRQMAVETIGNAVLTAAAGSGKYTSAQLNSFNTALGIGSQYGLILPFSRKQEYEADRIGLILMAMAGYDITKAVELWEKMSADGGSSVPAFMSTHPTDAKRIANLNKCMTEAIKYHPKYEEYVKASQTAKSAK